MNSLVSRMVAPTLLREAGGSVNEGFAVAPQASGWVT